MTPEMGAMLVNEVVPRLRAATPSVPKVGAEDDEEILADMTANAAVMIESAERAGRKSGPGNIAFYASRRTFWRFFGEDVIRRLLAGIQPAWESDLRAGRERHACRGEAVCREPVTA